MKKVLVLVLCLSVTSLVSADLVQHWAFEGDATNSVAGGVDGVINGGVSFIPGMSGQAAAFNGVDAFIDLPAQLSPTSTGLTLAFWVRLDTTAAWLDSFISTNGWTDTPYSIHAIVGPTPNNLVVGVASASYHSSGSIATIPLNDWTHCAWTYETDGTTSTLKYYLDGELDNTVSSTTDNLTGLSYEAAKIGAWANPWSGVNERFLNGRLDEMQIYNTALSQGEISAMVPEPMTLSLLALGGLALARRRR